MSVPRSSYAWIVTVHAIAGALVGTLEAVRLGSAALALALVPVFALTGLIAGGILALVERLAGERRFAPLAIAAPSLVVTVPVGHVLFRGAYAQTLPLAGVLPYVAPLAAWLGIAVLVWLGRRLAAGDLTMRAIAICGATGVLGGIVWAERHLLGTGYPAAQSAAAVSVIVLVGVILRVVRRVQLRPAFAAGIAALVLGSSVAAMQHGFDAPRVRALLANRGDHGRDLVRVWRQVLDFDRDGVSALLGGGDCDDFDDTRYPGAVDKPDDGIDQDCDGVDATRPAPKPAPVAPVAETAWSAADTLARTKGMNILLVTVDALRYELLAPDAPHRDDFPRIGKLLDESVMFTRAFSPAAGTDVSLSALHTGKHDPFQPIETTLAEAIRATNRRTSMAVPEEVMRHVGYVLLARGFDTQRPVYTDWTEANIGDHLSASTTTAEGLRAVDKAGARPWFAWLHYFDVHEHHQLKIPKAMLDRVWDGGSDAMRQYRALLRNIDDSLGKLFDELAKRNMLDNTIIVFASDHGEALGDDPRFPITHGQVGYAPLVHVPIAIRIPGVKPGAREDLVTLRDLAPTLVGLAGGTMQTDGHDLLAAILDGPAHLRPAKDRALVIHEELQWSVIEWPYQLVMRPADDLVELYDLSTDPATKTDLSAANPAVTTRLRARYSEVPVVKIDRTVAGRVWRDQQAQPPQPRARP